MSVQAMAWVLERSKSRATHRCVLVAIANHVDASTGEGWAYVGQLCREANCSEDSYHRAVVALGAAGELEVDIQEGGRLHMKGGYRPNLYRLPMFQAAGKRGPQDAEATDSRGPQDAQGRGPQAAHPGGPQDADPLSKEEPSSKPSKNRAASPTGERRADVDALCDLLVELIVANGCKKPSVTKAWRDEARRLLDRDRVPIAKARKVMRWALNDTFWRSNILSMPTFRVQFDRLRLASERDQQPRQSEAGFVAGMKF